MSSNDPFTSSGSDAMQFPQGTVASGPSATKIILIILGIVGVVGFLFCGLLVALLFPAVTAARNAAQNTMGSNQMKMIALAMHNYHSQFGQLPPAYTTDEQGKPLLSWRVALLPYIEAAHVANEIDPSKPWDAPENMAASQKMPAFFRAPNADPNVAPDMSTVFVVRADHSMFPGKEALQFADIKDGISNTLMLIQLPNHGVPWMKPEDLTPNEILKYAETIQGAQVIHLGWGDGAVSTSKSLDPDNFQAMVTIDGGEVVNRD